MKACPEHELELLSDLHGELAGEAAGNWRRHLAQCPGCRGEKDRLEAMLAQMKTGGNPRPLSPAERALLSGTRPGMQHPGGIAAPLSGIFRSGRLRWAAAVACGVLMLTGIYLAGWHSFDSGPKMATMDVPGVTLDAVDQEVVQHFDMLQDFSTIEKLVRVVGDADTPTPSGHEPGRAGENRALGPGGAEYA